MLALSEARQRRGQQPQRSQAHQHPRALCSLPIITHMGMLFGEGIRAYAPVPALHFQAVPIRVHTTKHSNVASAHKLCHTFIAHSRLNRGCTACATFYALVNAYVPVPTTAMLFTILCIRGGVQPTANTHTVQCQHARQHGWHLSRATQAATPKNTQQWCAVQNQWRNTKPACTLSSSPYPPGQDRNSRQQCKHQGYTPRTS
mmetsp:Transcript_32116/g.81629  ORF Transcript_32116/g.81629 Transcript_32116/m.81629 type:complete len:202 (-) Transcript_32116:252-857(-)